MDQTLGWETYIDENGNETRRQVRRNVAGKTKTEVLTRLRETQQLDDARTQIKPGTGLGHWHPHEEGRRVPQWRKNKRLTGIGIDVGAMCPIRPNIVRAMDFQFDTTADGACQSGLVPVQRDQQHLHRPRLAAAERLDRIVQRPAA